MCPSSGAPAQYFLEVDGDGDAEGAAAECGDAAGQWATAARRLPHRQQQTSGHPRQGPPQVRYPPIYFNLVTLTKLAVRCNNSCSCIFVYYKI